MADKDWRGDFMAEQRSLREKWEQMGRGGPFKALQGADKSQWLIDGLIAPNTINWMVASPESFKTFIALDMAACIASGRPWLGRQTRQATVIYISAEGGDDIHIRRAAIDTAANDTSSDFNVVQARPRLDDEEGLGFLCGLLLSNDGEESTEGTGVFYSNNIVIKHMNEKERELFEVLTDGYSPESFENENGSHDFTDYGVFDLDINKWNRVCDAFNYEKWNRQLPPEKQKNHPFLKVIFDHEEGKFIQLHSVDWYIDSLYSFHRYKGYDRGYAQGDNHLTYVKDPLIIIDTYSQTSTDDEKGTVSRFIKTLRDVQDKAKNLKNRSRSIGEITFLVIDHTTKQGDTFMGSLAKLGDCDTMMKVERPRKGRFATVKCIKMKVGAPFDPIHLDLKPIEIEGFLDANGKPLESLYVTSADSPQKSQDLKDATEETAASVVLRMVNASGAIKVEDLRNMYIGLDSNLDKRIDTVKKAFSRAIDSLKKRKLLHENNHGLLTEVTT